jgi:hypothetical protein
MGGSLDVLLMDDTLANENILMRNGSFVHDGDEVCML